MVSWTPSWEYNETETIPWTNRTSTGIGIEAENGRQAVEMFKTKQFLVVHYAAYLHTRPAAQW